MIREAKETDLTKILEIYNDAIIHTTAVYHYKPQSLEDRKQWYEQKGKEGYPVIVWEEEGEVAGFATFGPFRPWPAYKYTVEHSVYVDRDCRGKGVGTALLHAIIKLAEDGEYAVMVAGIDASNEDSIRIHKKLGFAYTGIIKKAGYKFGRWLDLVFYQRDLKGPENPKEDIV